MNSENKKSTAILALLPIIGLVISIVYAFGFADWTNVTPLFGLPTAYGFLLVAFVIPMVGSIMTAILMPRIVTSLFLIIKRKLLPKYKNAYLNNKLDPLQLRRWLSRALLTALLILGLISILVNIIDPRVFMSEQQYIMFQEEMGFPQLAPPVTFPLSGLIAPIAFGLWAASWAMEDAGLMHYHIPENDNAVLYEIEPVYRRYDSYLKGYAGLASIIFISWTIYLLWTANMSYLAVIFTILMPVFSILQTIPGYFVYARLSTSFLTSNLLEISRVSESDLLKSDLN